MITLVSQDDASPLVRSKIFVQEVRAAFLYPYLDILFDEHGPERATSFLARLGVTAVELREPGAWISFEFLQRFIDELVAFVGDDEIIRRGARLNVTPRYLGAFASFLKVIGSPTLFYRSLPSFSERFNRVSKIEVSERGRSSLVISYGTNPGYRETSKHICTGLKGQLAAVPTVWGLPAARVTELSCRWDGNDECVYLIEYQRRIRSYGAQLGALAGLASAALWSWWAPTWAGCVALVIAGLVTGALIDRARSLREARRFAVEQHRFLESLLQESELRFERALEEERRRREIERDKGRLESELHVSERMASIGMLASGVAHEINNPLAFILSNLEFLASRLDPASERAADQLTELTELHDAAVEARDGIRRIERIVKQLNLFSRSREPRTELVNPLRVIESTIHMIENDIRHRAQLRRALQPVAKVMVDPGQLGQVMLNLLLNATQAIPVGQASRHTITVATKMVGEDQVLLEVSDSGTGISAKDQALIFEPCFTKDVGVGTRLGLSVCGSIVTGLGGTIEVDSEQGRGSTFRVLLPAASWAPTPAPPPSLLPDAAARRARILIVDDELAILRAFKRLLASHEVDTARSVSEALGLVDESYDLILSDVMMPDSNGLHFYRSMIERWPAVASRVVFMSGGLLSSEIRDELSALPNRCLEKPIKEATLAALVSRAVAGQS